MFYGGRGVLSRICCAQAHIIEQIVFHAERPRCVEPSVYVALLEDARTRATLACHGMADLQVSIPDMQHFVIKTMFSESGSESSSEVAQGERTGAVQVAALLMTVTPCAPAQSIAASNYAVSHASSSFWKPCIFID